MDHYVITFVNKYGNLYFAGIDSYYRKVFYLSRLSNSIIYYDIASAKEAYNIIKEEIPNAKLQKIAFVDI